MAGKKVAGVCGFCGMASSPPALLRVGFHVVQSGNQLNVGQLGNKYLVLLLCRLKGRPEIYTSRNWLDFSMAGPVSRHLHLRLCMQELEVILFAHRSLCPPQGGRGGGHLLLAPVADGSTRYR